MRRYTSKIRAKRIELHYFKRLHPFRRWKLILTIAAPTLAAGWLIVLAARSDQRLYTSGPVSTAHAMFDVQCERCHVPSQAGGQAGQVAKGFWLRVTDQACLRCHDGPIHHDNQAFSPRCTSCHVEHKGQVTLAFMSNQHCTQCHGDLQTKDGAASTFERRIRSFAAGHPEFAVAVKEKGQTLRVRLDDKIRLKDTAQMKLNHEKHLKPGLKGIEDLKAQKGRKGLIEGLRGPQLTCSFCHQPDERRAYLRPILYARQCGPACHPLDFDARFPDTVVPHDKPLIVRAFLRGVFSEAFEECQTLQKQREDQAAQGVKRRCQELELIKGEEEGARPRGRVGRREAEEEKPQPEQWVATQLKNAESLVFKQKCEFCHTLTYVPEKLPEVATTAMPVRWLPHSRFDHGVHRPLACTECHKATQSKATTDVLLPSISMCRDCHRESKGARSGCVECHLYHDKTRDRDMNGPFNTRELVQGAPPLVPGASWKKP